ncbi:MAG: elongation factor Ts [Prevotella sp.]|nr:elongation factor Ts [Prevotella sp.]
MAVTIADIQKLRKMTGAGLADCKKALTEAEGDIEKAIELVRQRGLAIAAKRSDRETSNGCVLVKVVEGFGAMIALKCETDFVANGADFIALTQAILDAAVENKCKSLDEVKELTLASGEKVADAVVQRSGITGEKMELDGYNFIEGENIYSYNHQKKNILCTMVQLNKAAEEQGHNMTLQVANTNPMGLDVDSIPESVKESELKVAIEKTKEEQVQKAVEAALKKAGFNLYIAENEEHIAEGIAKGNITEEQAQEIRDLKVRVAEEKAANLPAQMIQNIAQGRLQKFFKDSCLVKQDYIWDTKMTVTDYLKAADKDLKVVAFKRFTLRAE